MENSTFIILPCPNCKVKNRIKGYKSEQTPVCAKCKTPLIKQDENETHAKYGQSLNNFFNLPDIGLRSDTEK
jgi:transposase-like protein